MKKSTFTDLVTVIIWAIPIVYLIIIYPGLPATVPLHYDIQGKVDRYGSKSELLPLVIILSFISLFVYLLLRFVPKIDPKKATQYGEKVFRKMALGVATFMSVLCVIILYTTLHPGVPIAKLIFLVVALLFCFLGNIMYNIRPNYFAGIRTPWTLEDPENWKATHRLAGKTWFIGGILMAVVTLLLPGVVAVVAFLIVTGIITLIPVVYSFRWFRKHHSHE